MNTTADRLTPAIEAMPVTARPHGPLTHAWPSQGRHVLIGWADAVRRDCKLADDDIANARAFGACEDGHTATEQGYRRVAAARDRLATLAALLTGTPTIEIRRGKQLLFRRTAWEHADRLTRRMKDLAKQGHPAARRFLDAQREAGQKLLIRHQLSHGMPPILGASPLAWIEVGHISGDRGIYHYQGTQLLAEGALDAAGITPATLFDRAVQTLTEARQCIEDARNALIDLVVYARLPLPPPEGIWCFDDTGELFLDRQAAMNARQDSLAAPRAIAARPTP
jgi:hypothetical protein